ncbi:MULTISPECIES: FxSxx-COOH cyclophane-containing RiPP peptide [Streptomyces]|uniref:FXSXX-COOH protein n=1 Tax=Streptomyces lycii TaxID=2654337 RepID=A0ABQ7F8M5_9ACTN|nr:MULTISPECIES: FxSxx-COOH cyclophane-containing RiPP peptide [Streptomyces]KAF4405264.1 FXSXX-COOH protein [Streptomyces lycii]PGH52284.1 FXSXX-COOH protein [Streptomyces sp. Ru87]
MTTEETRPGGTDAALPDLLDLDLSELRTVRHPVLEEVLAQLRDRTAEPTEALWNFNSSL